jgi:hypothetical protein
MIEARLSDEMSSFRVRSSDNKALLPEGTCQLMSGGDIRVLTCTWEGRQRQLGPHRT